MYFISFGWGAIWNNKTGKPIMLGHNNPPRRVCSTLYHVTGSPDQRSVCEVPPPSFVQKQVGTFQFSRCASCSPPLLWRRGQLGSLVELGFQFNNYEKIYCKASFWHVHTPSIAFRPLVAEFLHSTFSCNVLILQPVIACDTCKTKRLISAAWISFTS